MDDEEAFSHLHSVGLHAPDYNDFVQRLVSTLLNG